MSAMQREMLAVLTNYLDENCADRSCDHMERADQMECWLLERGAGYRACPLSVFTQVAGSAPSTVDLTKVEVEDHADDRESMDVDILGEELPAGLFAGWPRISFRLRGVTVQKTWFEICHEALRDISGERKGSSHISSDGQQEDGNEGDGQTGDEHSVDQRASDPIGPSQDDKTSAGGSKIS